MKALKEGKQIKRQCWNSTVLQYSPATSEMAAFIKARLWTGHYCAWIPTQDDLLEEDWLILD